MNRMAYVVVGPTAVGKSDFAVELALGVCGEIVSADSMQVYIGMDKGTSKPTDAEKRGVPHHMIDVANPRENYSVWNYAGRAKTVMEEIFARGKVPIICGGSGLYVHSLITESGFADRAGVSKNTGLDTTVGADADTYGTGIDKHGLYMQLVRANPIAAWDIHPNNVKRVKRALERLASDAEKYGLKAFGDTFTQAADFDIVMYRLTMDRKKLGERIDARADNFFNNGLVEEVEFLLNSGVPVQSTAMQGIGYKEVAAYLAGHLTRAEAITAVKTNTRHLAKRQETWFKRYTDAKLITVE